MTAGHKYGGKKRILHKQDGSQLCYSLDCIHACHVYHKGLVSHMNVMGQFPSCVRTMLCTFLGRPLSLLVERKVDSS